MAGKSCHAFASTTQFGLTQALGHTLKFPLTIVVLLVAGSTSAAGRLSLSMHPEKGCSILPLKDKSSITHVERSDSKIIFTAQTNILCGVEPENPTIERAIDTATISVTYDVTKAFHNCICAKTVSFEILNLPPEIKTIYLLENGSAIGHGYVP